MSQARASHSLPASSFSAVLFSTFELQFLILWGLNRVWAGVTDPQYAHNDGSPHIQNIYHHNNTQNMVWGNDRYASTESHSTCSVLFSSF